MIGAVVSCPKNAGTNSPSRLLPPSGVPILVIEDDFSIRRTLAQVLADEGHDVFSAANGRDALSLLVESAFQPRVIILDLWMPSMNGLEFRAIQLGHEMWADIPVLVITASRLLPRELRSLGLNDVLRKPLDLEAVLAKIEKLTAHNSPV
jgi:CheY-like chemotaxis protein